MRPYLCGPLEPVTQSDPDIAPDREPSPSRKGGALQSRVPISRCPRQRQKETYMEPLIRCCAGLHVHKETVEAHVRRIEPDGNLYENRRCWGTTTRELEQMSAWLEGQGVRHVAMESTGVFWKPVYNILEERFTVLLVNAQH